MELAFNLLLTILLELPIVGFFFKRKKRGNALLICFVVNIITWPLVNVIRLSTDWNMNIVEIGVVVTEAVAYSFLLQCGWRKGFLMSVAANTVSFLVTKFVYLTPDFFQNKSNLIIK